MGNLTNTALNLVIKLNVTNKASGTNHVSLYAKLSCLERPGNQYSSVVGIALGKEELY